MAVKLEDFVARVKVVRGARPDGCVHAVGEVLDSLGNCRSCGAVIVWGRMRGRPHPFDVDGASHFSTCQQAAEWRREERAESEAPAPDGSPTEIGAVFVSLIDWPALGVVAGDRGIVIETYHGGVTLLFRNGEFCGFSDPDLSKTCRFIGSIPLLYKMASSIALRFDFESRLFDRFFADAALLQDPGARS